MKKFFYENGLSIAFLILFLIAIVGQIYTGYHVYLKELAENGGIPIPFPSYLTTGHFLQSTFENWESEFLQMALYILLTVSLRQKGSSESKQIEGKNKTDEQPDPSRPGVPWPVKRGGIVLKVYESSLTIAFFILFIISWVLHFTGSIRDENVFRHLHGQSLLKISDYLTDSRLWFESFQNWQSEFLSVFAIVVLSIFLRQKGSSQSKPVNAPFDETGD
ncbi:MAG: DUF6766 family protein [Chloroflexota bacterium]